MSTGAEAEEMKAVAAQVADEVLNGVRSAESVREFVGSHAVTLPAEDGRPPADRSFSPGRLCAATSSTRDNSHRHGLRSPPETIPVIGHTLELPCDRVGGLVSSSTRPVVPQAGPTRVRLLPRTS